MAGKASFYQKVDQQFYDQVKKENGGKLPADLTDADGNPRPLTTSNADRAYRQKWNAIAAKERNSQAVVSKDVDVPCVPCALKAAAAKIPPIKLASKGGSSVSVPMVRPENRAPKPPPEPTPKDQPCNLQMLKLVEPAADISGKPGTRQVQVLQQAETQHRVCPTLIGSGGTFQITANSTYNPPRKVTVEAVMEAVCGARHPLLSVADASHRAESPETQDTLTFSRPPMSGDGELPGFWPVLNSIFQCGSETFPIEAQCCGVPGKQGGEEVESLEATIEVFPDDQYSLSLEIPALLKPDSLTYETKTSGWETEKDRKEKQVDEAGEEASDLYKSSQDLQDIGSEGEFKQFAEDLTKKQLQIEDETWSDQLSVKLTQTDGARTYEAPVDDLIRLVKMILSAEYAFKQIQNWVDNFQVGPGVQLEFNVQFFAGTIEADWGYTEFLDDRVFFAYGGSVELVLVKAELKLSAGWRTAGCADLLIVLSGEGSIGIKAKIEKNDPDQDPDPSALQPEGELKFTGSLEGTVFWVIKGSVGLTCTFHAETDDLKLLTKDCILGGKVVISRDPVYATYSYSKGLFGGTVTEQKEVIKGDPNLAEFDLS
jgi:hypothetical protein